jgi:uncharacterized membrane protein
MTQKHVPAQTPKERHLPFLAGFVLSFLSLVSLSFSLLQTSLALAAVIFFATYLVLTILRFPKMGAAFLKTNAANEDVPVVVIFLATSLVIISSVALLFYIINAGGRTSFADFSLSLVSVALGWLAIHTMAALHYAHLFWQPNEEAAPDGRHAIRRGLSFPDTPDPSISDFLYFAFVIGMTAQTSDIVINSTSMRRTTLVHAVVSFFFNTVLVAAAVNIAVSLHPVP